MTADTRYKNQAILEKTELNSKHYLNISIVMDGQMDLHDE